MPDECPGIIADLLLDWLASHPIPVSHPIPIAAEQNSASGPDFSSARE
jgi:hypothetical protein